MRDYNEEEPNWWTEFMVWTVVCVLFGALIFGLLWSRTEKHESEKDTGVTYLENSDSVELIGVDLVMRETEDWD